MEELINNEMISIEITTNDNSFINERRFPSNIRISDLKSRLELITGASHSTMKLELLSQNNTLIAYLDDNQRQLNSYLSDYQNNKIRIHVIDNNIIVGQSDDLSRVQKFELSREEYEKKRDSVLAFKKEHKLGRFAKDNESNEQSISNDIKVGQRCEVSVKGLPKRRATVRFVGNTNFKSGLWVGVEYDEPLGKNDGSVDGVRYFECRPKYGGFVRPNDLVVGDFPEITLDFDEEISSNS
jgi:tubulin-folding cofactor B